MLGWSQDRLAQAAGVSKPTINSFEQGRRSPMPQNLEAMKRALEEAGIEFIGRNTGGRGVRFQLPDAEEDSPLENES